MEEVIDDVWVGDLIDARHLDEDGIEIDHVICLSNNYTSVTTDHHPIRDGPCEYEKFASAVDTTIDAIESDGVVLVHCAAGQSRAPSVLATALAASGEYESFDKALSAIQSARPIANPLEPLRDRGKYYLTVDGSHLQGVSFEDWVVDQ